EVRNLAMRAADAAKNTSELIEGTGKKVSAGAELVAKTNEAFEQVTESTAKVGHLVSEISDASNEQSEGITQVSAAVSDMDTVVQQNAAGTEELSSQAGELKSKVGIMLEIVEGQQSGHSSARALPAGSPASQPKLAAGKEGEVRPDQVIPFDDDDDGDFKNF
ncbi:MAG: methyl-accepting chemotaxis protein, partial [Desulfobacterales bacterium]|nr:methyl-accepting chemotaxis protein [Desulfobacterales bacterium]